VQKFYEFWNQHNFPEEHRGMAAAIWFEASGQKMDDIALQNSGAVANEPPTAAARNGWGVNE
jgi:hypothetical protein